MKFLMSGGAHSKSHIHGYDWNALGEATVVDVSQKPPAISGKLGTDVSHRWVGLVVLLL